MKQPDVRNEKTRTDNEETAEAILGGHCRGLHACTGGGVRKVVCFAKGFWALIQEAVPVQMAERIHAVLERHPSVTRAELFGPRAKGNFREGSDIDRALQGAEMGECELAGLRSALDDEPIDHRVDLVLKKTITP